MSDQADPHVAHLQRFPVKALDRQTPDSVDLGAGGSVVGDRAWAIVEGPADEPHDPDSAPMSAYVNGKKTDAVHRLRTEVDRGAETITVGVAGGEQRREFPLSDPAALNGWLSEYFGREVSVRRGDAVGFPDRRRAPGPTVVATATLRTVADWFDLGLEAARRRFRTNVEVGGVEPFWEDRLVADSGVVGVRFGEAVLEGVELCGRCVVPARDADTGEAEPGFRERFSERRQATLPEWAPESAFDHAYKLAAVTRGADAEGATLSVGDPVEVLGTRPA